MGHKKTVNIRDIELSHLPSMYLTQRILQERAHQRYNMTLIIGAKTDEGIVILSDTRKTTIEGLVKKGEKVFSIIDCPDASIMVGISGHENYYEKIRKVLSENFTKSLKRAPISEERFVQILEECIEHQINDELNWRKINKKNLEERPLLPFVCIVGGRLKNNNEDKYVLYYYSSEDAPYYGDIMPIGIADYDAQIYDTLIKKIVKTNFRYENLPSKLVNQILFLMIRIVAKTRWDVAEPIFAHNITKKGYGVTERKEFFPVASDTGKPEKYILEILNTASKYFGSDKVPTLNELITIINDFKSKFQI